MTIDEIISYEKIEANLARKRAEEVQQMLDIPAMRRLKEYNQHDLIAYWLTELKNYRVNTPADLEKAKAVTAAEIIKIIRNGSQNKFYCKEDQCSGKMNCTACQAEYIEKIITEVYKCQTLL